MQASTTAMKITKLSEYIGAEVTGIDLRQPVDADTQQRLNAALIDNVALVIRDQEFTPQQFEQAVRLFGELMDQDSPQFAVEGAPLLRKVSNRNRDRSGKVIKAGTYYHTDHTNQVIPPKYTTLFAVEIPDRGGNTSVVNMRAGYSALPDDVKKRIDGMKTTNVRLGSAVKHARNPNSVEEQDLLKPTPVLQPLVRTNGDNGTKALYFHPNKVENIVGMTPEKSQDLLEELMLLAVKPEFEYSHKWRRGDMFIWDNRSALHKAHHGDYDPSQHRLLYRALVKGERPC